MVRDPVLVDFRSWVVLALAGTIPAAKIVNLPTEANTAIPARPVVTLRVLGPYQSDSEPEAVPVASQSATESTWATRHFGQVAIEVSVYADNPVGIMRTLKRTRVDPAQHLAARALKCVVRSIGEPLDVPDFGQTSTLQRAVTTAIVAFAEHAQSTVTTIAEIEAINTSEE